MELKSLHKSTEFTDSAKRLLIFARREAVMSNSAEIELVHLVLGFLREARSMFKARVPEVRVRLENYIGPHAAKLVGPDSPMLAVATAATIKQARSSADARGARIDLDDLMNALLRNADEQLANILQRVGFGA
jgi:ATP-dependent Clp protease ATP-binding subunit ClpA